MLLTFFKSMILIIVLGMLMPILVYEDNVNKDLAIAERDYEMCQAINYNFLYYQCVSGVQRRKMSSCTDFPQKDLRASCVKNTKAQKRTILSMNEDERGFSFLRYTPVWASTLGVIFFLFMIKGPGVRIHPGFEKMIKNVSEVLPQSDYFARQSFKTMLLVVLAMGAGLIIFFEILGLIYRG